MKKYGLRISLLFSSHDIVIKDGETAQWEISYFVLFTLQGLWFVD